MFGPSGAMPSTMSHDFSRVPKAEIQRSVFNRNHGLKTAFDAGYLVPIFVDEALPGDTFTCSMTGFGRLATPINPIMDNLYIETFFFAVSYRLVWDNWEKNEWSARKSRRQYRLPCADSVRHGGNKLPI